ncbi:MAG: tRNA (adenosine(37)-N6)-threonylcarbamoyltransferase complex ATPase subunit type 1 TsaE [Nitrospira sp.]|nr:tRNA (adenosine(37)-N6)-threonylcarbamoyltransferase complex ATPase subunit type 1 TsaE [Nitrospira sp.]MDH4303168.1 tRNA (adenosine(37)-N6)-threonylcarbamoyltransferase complex ATPase subunit type 1 TsaE [Nitrospira sp.]MDH5192703.1 tRNA (adenosine(37)-N6)-threonylcarbamoyltransferase complex ATPase subunit type 1 TsaE [Nitrospira sp.]
MARRADSPGFVLTSRRKTESIGKAIGKVLHEGDVIALIGDLGAGKTAFVRGIVSGLDAPPTLVASPTFMLMHQYQGRLPLTHVDLYRLKSPEEAEAIGLSEVFADKGVSAVEWADRFPHLLPSDRLEVRLSHRTSTTRSVQFTAQGTRSHSLLARLTRILPLLQKQRPSPRIGDSGKRKASHR